MEEACVLEEAVEVSSSPNGFFPQHTMVNMQFLNWRREEREGFSHTSIYVRFM
jgi:hypothetical protein